MKPADLREFAEKLYASTHPDADFGKEILELLGLVEVEETHIELCKELASYVPKEWENRKPSAQVERLGDRSDLLEEIEDVISKNKELLEGNGIAIGVGRDAAETVLAIVESLPKVYDL